MKKFIMVVLILVVLLAAFGGVVLVKLNQEKTSIDATTFYTTMTEKGYTVYDTTSQYEDSEYLTQAYIAMSNDSSYQIEYFEMEDASSAINFYANNKAMVESKVASASAQTELSFKNYSKYTLSANGDYYVVSRIDNTAIFIHVSDAYRDTVKTLLDELGY